MFLHDLNVLFWLPVLITSTRHFLVIHPLPQREQRFCTRLPGEVEQNESRYNSGNFFPISSYMLPSYMFTYM